MFAKKLKYVGSEDGFAALIEIARKKGGKPLKYILYRYNGGNSREMIEFKPEEKKLAEKSFPFGPIIYDEELLKNGLPKHMCRINPWKRTTHWLFDVAVGGGYEVHPHGTWAKVGLPAPRKTSRKGKSLRFGNLGQILAIKKELLKKLEQEEIDLMNERVGMGCDCGPLPEWPCTCEDIQPNEALERQLEEKEKEIEKVACEIFILKERMRYVIKKKSANV